jgi:CubicO group peptidase (beta-lactamase class C family)
MIYLRCTTIFLLILFISPQIANKIIFPTATPESAGMSSEILEKIDIVITEAINLGQIPGAIVLIGRKGKAAFKKVYGNRSLLPKVEPMTLDTVFDTASLTKVVATASSIMLLYQMGKLHLDDPITEYIPEFGKNGKSEITIRQLLTHFSGMPFEDDLSQYENGKKKALDYVYSLPIESKPGEKFTYSGIGYIVLGEIVKRVSGKSLDKFAREKIFEPLGMYDTAFNPGWRLRRRTALTTMRDGKWLKGNVQDPRAERLGGVAGHAGLFSTLDDLAIYCQMILNGGVYDGVGIFKPEIVREMIMPYVPEDRSALRGLGWDINSDYSKPRGALFLVGSFGHTGYSGTSFWIDPATKTFVIILTNRVHPDNKRDITNLRIRIATLAAMAIK